MKPELLLSRIRVVLCRPSHPGNIGAVARAMKTMGLSDLCLVEPRAFPDPQADARATGAVDLLKSAKITGSLPEALADAFFVVALSARRRDLGPPSGQPREMAASSRSVSAMAPRMLSAIGCEYHEPAKMPILPCGGSARQ